MKFGTYTAKVAVVATICLTVIAPLAAHATSRQTTKNNWRNAAIAGGAVALYGLHKHDTTTTVLGAAGAAYSANRYEQDRKHQGQEARARARYYRTHHRYHHRHHRR